MKSKLTTHLLVSWFLSILSESSEHVIPKKKVDNVNQQAKGYLVTFLVVNSQSGRTILWYETPTDPINSQWKCYHFNLNFFFMNIVPEITFANKFYNTIKKMDCKINISRLLAFPFFVWTNAHNIYNKISCVTYRVWPPEGKILIPWHGLHMHTHATFVCVKRACGLSSRDTACMLAILSTSLCTDQLIILTQCQTDENEEPFILHTFSSWLWTCWTIRSKATKFSPPGETMEGDCYNKAHNSIILSRKKSE